MLYFEIGEDVVQRRLDLGLRDFLDVVHRIIERHMEREVETVFDDVFDLGVGGIRTDDERDAGEAQGLR